MHLGTGTLEISAAGRDQGPAAPPANGHTTYTARVRNSAQTHSVGISWDAIGHVACMQVWHGSGRGD